ncbi:MAG: hypothetical protein HYX21_01420 [Candidatus Yanofskybacteria bacterium]|nr:hypothetical protein [Candidatus Yanofskybacteria bacterium]
MNKDIKRKEYSLTLVFLLVGLMTIFYPEITSAAEYRCEYSLVLSANPRQVQSASQEVNLEARIAQTSSTTKCTTNAQVIFLHGDNKQVGTKDQFVNHNTALFGNDAWVETRSEKATPASLGYENGQTVCFYFKLKGHDSNNANFEITSASVPVGVGMAPGQCKSTAEESVPPNAFWNPGSSSFNLNVDIFKFKIDNPLAGKADNIIDLLAILANFIFQLGVPVAVIIIIYSGILYLVSADRPAVVQKATNGLKYAAIGLAVLLIGKGFVSLVQSILSVK